MNIPINESSEEKEKDGYPTKSILIVLLVFLVVLYVVL
jgi:hypothetical protein